MLDALQVQLASCITVSRHLKLEPEGAVNPPTHAAIPVAWAAGIAFDMVDRES